MHPTRDGLQEWDLPHLKDTILLKPHDKYWLYDAKFYPYAAAGVDMIFAVGSISTVLVYRICQKGNQDVQLIRRIEDEDEDAFNSSLVWSKDRNTGSPLLCIAGGNAKIKIRDARTGALRVTFVGHGGDINDLAISPANPEVLASASADNTVRIWSLNPAHRKQPCAVLCAGEGHLDTVLSVAFHGTGRFILSGGQDHVINLWVLPEITPDYIESQQPVVVHFPHFSTSEVHSNIVDCVAFHGDLILSKGFNEHCIVLWQITGFDSSASLPFSTSAPANYNNKRGTRSAFSGSSETTTGSRQYVRLIEFDMPGCLEFYMRFSLSSNIWAGVTHPILAVCNSRSKVLFWDLSRLDEYHRHTTSAIRLDPDRSQPLSIWLASVQAKEKKNAARGASLSPSLPSVELSASAKGKYAMGNPMEALEAHKVVAVPKVRFDGRQVAWSSCGRWCVIAATRNVVLVLGS